MKVADYNPESFRGIIQLGVIAWRSIGKQSIVERFEHYINQMEHRGKADSFKTTWMNQSGLELAGYSMDEIIQLGNEFYKELIHPDDLVLISFCWNYSVK